MLYSCARLKNVDSPPGAMQMLLVGTSRHLLWLVCSDAWFVVGAGAFEAFCTRCNVWPSCTPEFQQRGCAIEAQPAYKY